MKFLLASEGWEVFVIVRLWILPYLRMIGGRSVLGVRGKKFRRIAGHV